MTALHAIANMCMYTLNISKYIYYIYHADTGATCIYVLFDSYLMFKNRFLNIFDRFKSIYNTVFVIHS